MENKGKIWFVGAGSGASDLITLRGMKLLQKADMIVYAGSLVNPELLENAKADCEIHDSSRLHLDQVMELMIPAALSGKCVVRLHTGDPSIYGAIREQMDRLDAAGVEYEVCPGVSSFCGAAAALKKEYTLPGVSQTLILTRMEGRTPVPEGERIRALATHGASMALFLSASMLKDLQAELLAGGEDARRAGLKGYDESTPCAIVYKATWPDEKKIETTLGELAQAAADAGITKTALILVGGFLGDEYELSKLYDAGFSTEFRKAECADDVEEAPDTPDTPDKSDDEAERVPVGRQVLNIAIVSYTDKGAVTAQRAAETISRAPGLAVNIRTYEFSRDAVDGEHTGDDACCDVQKADTADSKIIPLNFASEYGSSERTDGCRIEKNYFSDTEKLVKEIFFDIDAIIFVSAAGIAVRHLAPYAVNKLVDPAAIVINDNCDYVIPLLSGHIGGANMLAEMLADGLGAEAIITTASDVAGVKAVDMFAKENGFAIEDMDAAKLATAALLKRTAAERDEQQSRGDDTDNDAEHVQSAWEDAIENYFEVSEINGKSVLTIDNVSVVMRPLKYCVGIGCKKGTDMLELAGFVKDVLQGAGIAANEVYRVASIDIKAGEDAIKAVADLLRSPYYVYSAEELAGIKGDFTGSEFVKSVVGVDSVCERSAAAACGGAYRMVVKKQSCDGMTIAVAERV